MAPIQHGRVWKLLLRIPKAFLVHPSVTKLIKTAKLARPQQVAFKLGMLTTKEDKTLPLCGLPNISGPVAGRKSKVTLFS